MLELCFRLIDSFSIAIYRAAANSSRTQRQLIVQTLLIGHSHTLLSFTYVGTKRILTHTIAILGNIFSLFCIQLTMP